MNSQYTKKALWKLLSELPERKEPMYVFCSLRLKNEVITILKKEEFFLPSTELTSLDGMKRDDVIPYYRWLIIMASKDEKEPQRLAEMVKQKWSVNALHYILKKAWEGLM